MISPTPRYLFRDGGLTQITDDHSVVAELVRDGRITPEEAERVFAALSGGGTITMPFGPTFWASAFGMCVDRFGIGWMVNCSLPAEVPAGAA